MPLHHQLRARHLQGIVENMEQPLERHQIKGRKLQHESIITLMNVNEAEVKEEQVCWLCGGTPCDWEEHSAELLQQLEEKFPLDGDGKRFDAGT